MSPLNNEIQRYDLEIRKLREKAISVIKSQKKRNIVTLKCLVLLILSGNNDSSIVPKQTIASDIEQINTYRLPLFTVMNFTAANNPKSP